MGRLLRFLIEESLAGRGAEIKEYSLGVLVFDRGDSFDPRIDPIVRVEARRLRTKLAAYFESEGREEPLVIEIPSGSYQPKLTGARAAPPVPAPEAVPAATDIAVMPFANLNPGNDTEYFSDGLTSELIHALTAAEGIRVVAWNTVAQMREIREDWRSVGRQLNVGTVLQGSVRCAGERLRVLVNLVDSQSGFVLWSETFDRKRQDIFAIQEEIAHAIVRSLQARLLGVRSAPVLAKRPAPKFDAYDLYLRGRFHWSKRTRDGFERAVGFFQQAIEIDPGFATAYAGLADAYSLFSDYGLKSPGETMPKAKAAALRALELDPRLGEAHVSLGLIESLYEWRWDEAGERYRRAIALSPGYATGHHWYGCDYLALLGRFDEALAECRLAVRLDPLSTVVRESQSYVLMLAGRLDEALERHGELLDLAPDHYKSYTAMGRIYLQKRMYPEAVEMLERSRSIAGDLPTILGALTEAYARSGARGKAEGLLNQLLTLRVKQFISSTTLAIAYLALDEVEQSLQCLEQGCDGHELNVSAIGVHPVYDPLRGLPRFQTLLKRVGLNRARLT